MPAERPGWRPLSLPVPVSCLAFPACLLCILHHLSPHLQIVVAKSEVQRALALGRRFQLVIVITNLLLNVLLKCVLKCVLSGMMSLSSVAMYRAGQWLVISSRDRIAGDVTVTKCPHGEVDNTSASGTSVRQQKIAASAGRPTAPAVIPSHPRPGI